ncbi:MAG: hypothetical protein HKO95_08195 [Rhodobacteraceae bacterium]|nr:hypothetical protein [Alphaproteobacteria bacterium]NNK66703.1 hypothetical protein [Paracoccaceae bacterium]
MNVDGFLQDVVFEWLSESPTNNVEGCLVRPLDTSPPQQKGAPNGPFQMSLAGLAYIMPPMLAARTVSTTAFSPNRLKLQIPRWSALDKRPVNPLGFWCFGVVVQNIPRRSEAMHCSAQSALSGWLADFGLK